MGLELYYKLCISGHKLRRKLQLIGFHTMRKVQLQSCGKTKGMSTSHAREINNNKELRLRHVRRKECCTIDHGVGKGSLISILSS